MPLLQTFANSSARGFGAFLPPAGGGGAFEQIATVVGNGGSTTVSLSSIPQTYKHLQIRFFGRVNFDDSGQALNIRANGDTGVNYSSFDIGGGTSVTSQNNNSSLITSLRQIIPGTQETAGFTGYGVIDILNYTSGSYKTFQMLSGRVSNIASTVSVIALLQANWRSSSAITSLDFTKSGPGNWTSETRFTIYGIKG
jgi:hypothetical protein